LFENYQEVETTYFQKTGIFPIMHTVAMREDLWGEHPWIATSLYKAFQKSKQMAYERLNDLSPYKLSMVWFREPMASGRFWGKTPGATVLRETALLWRRSSAISTSRS
jgi:4,5-dihydroxyphthalate decarboxylase